MTDPTAATGQPERTLLAWTSPSATHLSRLAQIGEQFVRLSGKLVGLLHNGGVQHDLTGAEADAVRNAASTAHSAGELVVPAATAAERRADRTGI
ncbi:hypothetical protein ACIBEF_32245 [Micromonospora sp. NPDC050795]|uniref:hypothetical protein n=1 Tax=Micromonospora sp. NPDC050795 TaxID=3364282 RepID=UPI0037BDC41D